jgi:hypothetical protein
MLKGTYIFGVLLCLAFLSLCVLGHFSLSLSSALVLSLFTAFVIELLLNLGLFLVPFDSLLSFLNLNCIHYSIFHSRYL